MPTITTTRASMGVCPLPPFSAPTIHSKAVCSSCAPTCEQSWSLARTFRRRPGFRSFDTLDFGSELQEGELSSSPLSKLPRNKSDPSLGSLGLELEDAGAPQSLPASVSPKQGLPLPAGGACTPEPLSPSGSLKISYPPAAERAAADGAPVVPGLMRWASLRAPLGVVPEALERTRSGASQLEVGPGGVRRDEMHSGRMCGVLTGGGRIDLPHRRSEPRSVQRRRACLCHRLPLSSLRLPPLQKASKMPKSPRPGSNAAAAKPGAGPSPPGIQDLLDLGGASSSKPTDRRGRRRVRMDVDTLRKLQALEKHIRKNSLKARTWGAGQGSGRPSQAKTRQCSCLDELWRAVGGRCSFPRWRTSPLLPPC